MIGVEMGVRLTRIPLGSGRQSLAVRLGLVLLGITLKVSPRPTVRVIRWQFAKTGAQLTRSFRAEAPADIAGVINERYDDDRHARFDL
jgi:hypothetical protein